MANSLFSPLSFGMIVVLIVTQFCSNSFALTDGHLDLVDILPEKNANYDKLVPPIVTRGKAHDPAVIKHFIYVVGIDSINEASMSFAADIFFTQRWRDHRLRYPSSMSLNQSTINPDWLDDIWHPDVYFRNAKSIKLQTIPVPNRVLQIRNDKSIVNFWRLTLELSCAMNFALYPHDRHECKIEIESMSYPESVVKLMWGYRPLKMENKFQIPQLVLVEAYTKTSYRPYTSGNYSSLEVVFLLKRSMGYYLMTTYIPTCLIVVVSWISFWIRPEALPARVTLSVTSLLTLLTQHSKSQESLPRVSYLKIVDAFMLSSIIFVFLPLIEMCVVIIILYGLGSWKLMTVAPKSSECFKTNEKTISRLHPMEHSVVEKLDVVSCDSVSSFISHGDSDSFFHRRRQALKMDLISRMLFPSLFIFLNCVYWFCAIFLL